jgi:hypothetical protein
MAWFQLDPQSIATRARATDPPSPPPTLAASLLRGVVGFTLVSVAGFAPWAFGGAWFYPRVGEAGLYATCAVVFIVLSGLLLHPLIIGPGSLARFYKLFGFAFAAYSAAWIGCWMWLGGDAGGITGLLSGTIAMGAIFVCAFDAPRAALPVIVALFALNTLGYYAGGWAMDKLVVSQMRVAMLLWGVGYGVGLGAGLGFAFHRCQAEARALLGRAA